MENRRLSIPASLWTAFPRPALAEIESLLLALLAPIFATTWLKRAFDEVGVRVGPRWAQDRDLKPAPRLTLPTAAHG